jgi:hypothetical protein
MKSVAKPPFWNRTPFLIDEFDENSMTVCGDFVKSVLLELPVTKLEEEKLNSSDVDEALNGISRGPLLSPWRSQPFDIELRG